MLRADVFAGSRTDGMREKDASGKNANSNCDNNDFAEEVPWRRMNARSISALRRFRRKYSRRGEPKTETVREAIPIFLGSATAFQGGGATFPVPGRNHRVLRWYRSSVSCRGRVGR